MLAPTLSLVLDNVIRLLSMIRSAEARDFGSINSIQQALILDVKRLGSVEYVSQVENNGFLVPKEITREQFMGQLPSYVVGEVEGVVAGFLRIEDIQEMDESEIPAWIDPVMESVYWQRPHANIGKIAVHPQAKRQGVASTLLAEAERRAREVQVSYLFSFIACCKPPTNYPSIRFHENHGFRETAPLAPQSAFGINDYRASLYSKKLI